MIDYIEDHVGEAVHVAGLEENGVAVARFERCPPPAAANLNASGFGASGGADAGPTVGVWLRPALVDPGAITTASVPAFALVPDLMLQAYDVAGVGVDPSPDWAESRLFAGVAPMFLADGMTVDELVRRVAVVARALLGVPEPGDLPTLLEAGHRPLREWAMLNAQLPSGGRDG